MIRTFVCDGKDKLVHTRRSRVNLGRAFHSRTPRVPKGGGKLTVPTDCLYPLIKKK